MLVGTARFPSTRRIVTVPAGTITNSKLPSFEIGQAAVTTRFASRKEREGATLVDGTDDGGLDLGRSALRRGGGGRGAERREERARGRERETVIREQGPGLHGHVVFVSPPASPALPEAWNAATARSRARRRARSSPIGGRAPTGQRGFQATTMSCARSAPSVPHQLPWWISNRSNPQARYMAVTASSG